DVPKEAFAGTAMAAAARTTHEAHEERGSAAAAGAAPTAAEPTARPPLKLADLVAEPGFAGDSDTALLELFALWGARYDAASGDPCAQAERQGLACFYQPRGSISELKRLNRPAILTL